MEFGTEWRGHAATAHDDTHRRELPSTYAGGRTLSIQARVSINVPVEWEYKRDGGTRPMFFRRLASGLA